MTILLQDGAANSHRAWCEEAVSQRVAQGAIISPFFTPATPRRGQAIGATLADCVRSAGGEVHFDATTHAAVLPGVDNWTSYNTWDLWEGARGDLSTDNLRLAHVERVFAHQVTLGAPSLAPTVALDSASGSDAEVALGLAEIAAAASPDTAQSLAGRRGFWLSEDLDQYVGMLAQLRAPVWFVTFVRESDEYPPDARDVMQLAAFCRTVDSLARRSRVVVCHGDLFGLPAVAAGADALGTGWHTKQRVCSPATFQTGEDQVRRQAFWLTYEVLLARLHQNDSDILNARDRARAERLYSGPISATRRDARLHHLAGIGRTVGAVTTATDRIAELRARYEVAMRELDDLSARYGPVHGRTRFAYIDGLFAGLEAYARDEGRWT